ncbi:MAG TPA: hypothetical protein VKC90_01315 [Chitinophagaceae bacterium]|nr:hypothetical protein [Chitinophagaceae bacterium]
MIKEAKNIDLYTSGRQPLDKDFARISEWIRKKKEEIKKSNSKSKTSPTTKTFAIVYQSPDIEQ